MVSQKKTLQCRVPGVLQKESLFHHDDESESEKEQENYYAVIALDGDEMGKWISGVKNPTLIEQLSKEAADYFDRQGDSLKKFLESRRPLSPSFHLQFSESLANFSLYCTSRIVESFNGRLIYAGGDDVLAMLPASQAMACAIALRDAFQGNHKSLNNLQGTWETHNGKPIKVEENRLFDCQADGYLRIHQNSEAMERSPKSINLCYLDLQPMFPWVLQLDTKEIPCKESYRLPRFVRKKQNANSEEVHFLHRL